MCECVSVCYLVVIVEGDFLSPTRKPRSFCDHYFLNASVRVRVSAVFMFYRVRMRVCVNEIFDPDFFCSS